MWPGESGCGTAGLGGLGGLRRGWSRRGGFGEERFGEAGLGGLVFEK